jgi:hypothetical protein
MRSRVLKPAAVAARRHVAVLVAGVLVWLFTWPEGNLLPIAGLDGAWQVGLHMAAADGLNYGSDVVYTYGPLGFLLFPTLVDPTTVRAAFAYEMGLHLLLSITLVAALRPTFRLLPAVLLAFLVASLGVNSFTTIGLVWLLALLLVPMAPMAARALAAGLGVLIGIELLGKLNLGIVMLALAAVAVVALPPERRREVGLPLGIATVASVLLAWFVTGQSLGALPGFLGGSVSIIAGYSSSMGQVMPDDAWQPWAAIPLVVAGLAAATRGEWRPDRIGAALAVMWAILAFTSFKEGFVRQDPGHAATFYRTMLGGLAAFALIPRRPSVALLAGALAAVCLCATFGTYPAQAIRPFDRADALFDQISLLADGSQTNDAIAASRAAIAASAPLDEKTFAEVRDHDVHVSATLASTAWAYRLRWHPLPVFQSYVAYTESLDRRNADEALAADGPDRILVHNEPDIDGRNAGWEQPLATRAILCHFRPVSTTTDWQVLARAGNRCGQPRLLDEVETKYGAATAVPVANAGEAVYMEVEGLEPHGFERLRTLALRSLDRWVTYDDGRVYRVMPGTAGGGLLLAVPPAGDYRPPFSLDQNVRTLMFTRSQNAEQSGDLTLRFFALPIRR